MDVSVVVTCWNGRNLLEKNLPLVLAAVENPGNKIKEVIVVDDASSDGSAEFLKKNYPQVTVVSQPKNYGYSVTCNTGVQRARGDLVVILNADVIPSGNFLEKVVPLFSVEKVFSVTFNEGRHGPGKIVWEKGFLELKPEQPATNTVNSDWANGGSSIFRKSMWEKLAGMDCLFLPFYFEDVDLGLRARKAGWICLWEPKALVEHQHEATINPKNFSLYKRKNDIALVKERNHLLLTWKHLKGTGCFVSHFFYLCRRCLLTPGYLKVVFSAAKRRCLW